MMRKEREPYDPKIYGELKADFLNNVAQIPVSRYSEQERERLNLIKDIKEGKLAPTQPKEAED